MSTYIVNPVEVRMKESAKGSIYQSIVAMGIRARQINDQIKMQLTARMENVETDADEAEGPNYDKLAISREFDVLPKPIFIAMKEVMDDKLNVRMNDEK
jgi:DNA-directed RNA polymerase subunit K/omega